MRKLIFSKSGYIAERNEAAADRVEAAIYEACEFVADGPSRGHSTPDFGRDSLRSWTLTRYPNYTIVYRVDMPSVVIVAVLHGKRDITRILKRR